ncbi:hypothetical protein T01_15750 [Trichinella spiralis]|uniref:Uncharacterized protein n=1 Tax=Trichinella spiralis TaxID=6334 RepID=A0A0V1BEM9_TRISP|nr:hypothetical protein T01_15750 [Trichinella spiralis]
MDGLSTYNCRVMYVVSHLVDFHWNCDINPNYHAIYNQFIRLGSRGETNWAREAFASAASFNASTSTHSLIFASNARVISNRARSVFLANRLTMTLILFVSSRNLTAYILVKSNLLNKDEIIVSAMRIAFTFDTVTIKFSLKRSALLNFTSSVDGSTAFCLENRLKTNFERQTLDVIFEFSNSPFLIRRIEHCVSSVHIASRHSNKDEIIVSAMRIAFTFHTVTFHVVRGLRFVWKID